MTDKANIFGGKAALLQMMGDILASRGPDRAKRADLLRQAFGGNPVDVNTWRKAWGDISVDTAMEAMRHHYRLKVLDPEPPTPNIDITTEPQPSNIDIASELPSKAFWHRPPTPVLPDRDDATPPLMATGPAICEVGDCYNNDPNMERREAERARAQSRLTAQRYEYQARIRNSGNKGGSGGPEEGGGCGSGGSWMR